MSDQPLETRLPDSIALGGLPVALGWCAIGRASPAQLTERERQLLRPSQTGKRQAELCAGRVAVHRALERLSPPARGDVVPVEGGADSGRPVLAQDPAVSLSISHSSPWAAGAAWRGGGIGIDLELQEARSPGFLEAAFAPGELDAYQRLPLGELDPVTCAWALKEAVLKVLGVGLRAPLQRVRIRPAGLRRHGDGWALELQLDGGGGPGGDGGPGCDGALEGYLESIPEGLVLAAAGSVPDRPSGRRTR